MNLTNVTGSPNETNMISHIICSPYYFFTLYNYYNSDLVVATARAMFFCCTNREKSFKLCFNYLTNNYLCTPTVMSKLNFVLVACNTLSNFFFTFSNFQSQSVHIASSKNKNCGYRTPYNTILPHYYTFHALQPLSKIIIPFIHSVQVQIIQKMRMNRLIEADQGLYKAIMNTVSQWNARQKKRAPREFPIMNNTLIVSSSGKNHT